MRGDKPLFLIQLLYGMEIRRVRPYGRRPREEVRINGALPFP